jgi:hypothetical protein
MPIALSAPHPLTAGSERAFVIRLPSRRSVVQTLFALAIFLSAFLLFQVELLLGKQILPIFGGAPAVWTTCLLVFQLLLLAGYTFAHGVAVRLKLREQALIQLSLLGLSLCVFVFASLVWSSPITPLASWHPASGDDPTWTIVRFLLATIGLPFFVLSTTSSLALHWLAKTAPGNPPYRLYALSNAGSLLGLLSYPVLIEPNLRLRTQAWAWTVSYAVYAVAFGICALLVMRAVSQRPEVVAFSEVRQNLTSSPGWPARFLWVALAACASVLLLATTNYICQELAVIPFLWVLPLSLYLLSFIFCFESDRWYRQGIFHALFVLAASAVILVIQPNADYSYVVQLAAYSALLFAGCMVCHGEAARTRPHADHLTEFYLCLSIGGALGGIFVGLIAPRIFPNYWEYPLGILACTALILFVSMRETSSWWHSGPISLGIALFGLVAVLTPPVLAAVWPAAARFPRWGRLGVAGALLVLAAWVYLREQSSTEQRGGPWAVRLAARCSLAVITAGLAIPQKADFFHVVERSRNFYGVLSVIDAQPENYLALRHGEIVHGFQFEDAARSRLATAYYGENSAANIVIRHWPHHPMRVGLVGMGTGTLASIGQPGDVYRFYEINPDVYRSSEGPSPYFTFLKDSRAQIEVVLGDARGSLQREAQQNRLQKFDVLILDAFSSDAIPMHLLTREAFQVFTEHMRGPESVIAVHISNRTLDLGSVVAGVAREFGMSAIRNISLPSKSYLWESEWVLLSRTDASLDLPELKPGNVPFAPGTKPILWTDDYSSLWRVIRRAVKLQNEQE